MTPYLRWLRRGSLRGSWPGLPLTAAATALLGGVLASWLSSRASAAPQVPAADDAPQAQKPPAPVVWNDAAQQAIDQAHAACFEDDPFPSAKKCAKCHEGHFREWSVSPHAYAQLSPVFNAMLEHHRQADQRHQRRLLHSLSHADRHGAPRADQHQPNGPAAELARGRHLRRLPPHQPAVGQDQFAPVHRAGQPQRASLRTAGKRQSQEVLANPDKYGADQDRRRRSVDPRR